MLGEGGLPSHDTRRWQSGPHLRHSLERLAAVLDYLERTDIRMYRLATALAPYASHPELTQFHGQIEECADELAEVGASATARGIRFSSHPGQYTVLNSHREEVQAVAAADLEVQASLFDAMGLGPEAVVVLHVGGSSGGTAAGAERFLRGTERLSDRARRRLVIENDDRLYGLADVLDLAQRAGLRVVFDVHHHRCHDPEGIEEQEALQLALATWPSDQTPKIHFSSPRDDVERAHADYIDRAEFARFVHESAAQRDFDVMLEAKAKDLALLRLREQLAATPSPASPAPSGRSAARQEPAGRA